jgi:hypothetical protein
MDEERKFSKQKETVVSESILGKKKMMIQAKKKTRERSNLINNSNLTT